MTSKTLPDTPDALKNVGAALAPGKLSEKIAEFEDIIACGDSALFDGEVSWTVMLREASLRVKGSSESVDEAFAQMCAVMKRLLDEHGDEDEVLFTLSAGA
jgi:hypothetical protein